SLAGTVADGELAVDESGRLVVTRETRRFFDYFLAGGGEEGVGRAKARLVAEVRKRLPVSAVPEAIGLLDRYLAYRRRAWLAEQAPDVGARVSLLHALREQTLGAEAARAFFADEEAADEAAIERARISADPSLDDAERERRAARLEERLPEPVREARAQALAPLRLMQDEERLRASGASPAEIRALRERSFGTEAADRLEDLDRQRAAWQRRLDDYREARDAIARSDSLDAGARDRAIETLRAERFTPEERLRVVALDRIRETQR
ncbi:MAG: lipase chaperone, partial [Deltaproteobacteria bacterium]